MLWLVIETRRKQMTNPMAYAANPLLEGKTSMRQMIRELYNPTAAEIRAHRVKKEALDKERREAIAKLENEGWFK
jgi:hypothetical protein